jgi:hypothetical protein
MAIQPPVLDDLVGKLFADLSAGPDASLSASVNQFALELEGHGREWLVKRPGKGSRVNRPAPDALIGTEN